MWANKKDPFLLLKTSWYKKYNIILVDHEREINLDIPKLLYESIINDTKIINLKKVTNYLYNGSISGVLSFSVIIHDDTIVQKVQNNIRNYYYYNNFRTLRDVLLLYNYNNTNEDIDCNFNLPTNDIKNITFGNNTISINDRLWASGGYYFIQHMKKLFKRVKIEKRGKFNVVE